MGELYQPIKTKRKSLRIEIKYQIKHLNNHNEPITTRTKRPPSILQGNHVGIRTNNRGSPKSNRITKPKQQTPKNNNPKTRITHRKPQTPNTNKQPNLQMKHFYSQSATRLFKKGQPIQITEELEKSYIVRYRKQNSTIQQTRINKSAKLIGTIQQGTINL